LKEKKINRIVCEPVLAPLLAERRWALLVFVVGAIQTVLTIYGCGSWPCPMRTIVGLPCPGCGLSRGLVNLLNGQWQAAIDHHLFSPILFAVLLVLGIGSCLPHAAHGRLVRSIRFAERRTGISFIFLSGMFVIWVLRIVDGYSTRIDYQTLTMNFIGR
jgi:hypothetical protein